MSRSNVKGQGHQGQKNALSAADTPGCIGMVGYALAANNVQQKRTGPFRGCQGVCAVVSSAISTPVGKSAHAV